MQPCFTPLFTSKGFDEESPNWATALVWKDFAIWRSFGGHPIRAKTEESVPAHQVKSFCEVYERGAMACFAIWTFHVVASMRRSYPLLNALIWNRTGNRDRFVPLKSAVVWVICSQKVDLSCSEVRYLYSCYNHSGQPCSCREWWYWSLACLEGLPTFPNIQ